MEEQYKGSEDQTEKNHPHGGRLRMDEDYKGHHIQSLPRHLLPDSNRWTVHVVINWMARSREQFREFEVKRGFATQEELSGKDLHSQRSGSMTGSRRFASVEPAGLNE